MLRLCLLYTSVSWWFLDRLFKWMQFWIGSENLKGTVIAVLFYKLLGARLAWNVTIDEPMYEFDLFFIEEDTNVESQLSAASLHDGVLTMGPVYLKKEARIGMQAVVERFSVLPTLSCLDDMSCLSRGTTLRSNCFGKAFSGSPSSTKPCLVRSSERDCLLHVLQGLVEWAVITFCRSGFLIAVSYTHLDVYKGQR